MTDWTDRFLKLAVHIAEWSKDPSTKIGCVIVGPDREIRSTGFNGFPRGVADDYRLDNREEKYPLICHAEENAVLHAARIGVQLKGCIAFVTHHPCARCARALIQAGILEVVCYDTKIKSGNWEEDQRVAFEMLLEAGVTVNKLYKEEL